MRKVVMFWNELSDTARLAIVCAIVGGAVLALAVIAIRGG